MSSIIPQLLPIEINNEKKKNTVLTNIIKMLSERKIIKKEDIEKHIKKLISTQTDDLTYKVELPNYKSEDDRYFIIRLINQKITAVNKASGISDFLHNFKNNQKIIVVSSINNKAKQYINNNYPRTDIFLEKELMINIIDKVEIPQHVVLSTVDAERVLQAYNAIKRNMPKILSSDPVARYFRMQPGQVCKIIRPSETSGKVPYYRLVVKAPSATKS